MRGETVIVRRKSETGTDPGGNPITETTEEAVENVLTSPGPRDDVDDSQRPEGVTVAWTLHMPKLFTGSLRGAEIKVRDDEFRRVVGSPQRYMSSLTPGPWNMPVELEGTEG